jgi:hypothetical protein
VSRPPYHPPATTPGAARFTGPGDGATHFFPRPRVACALHTAGMSSGVPAEQQAAGQGPAPARPEHLPALAGSRHGPADLGRNPDKYLTYADREEAGGAAPA